MNAEHLVQSGTYWNSDGGDGPWAPPHCRLSESTAAWDHAPEWLREVMPLSSAELDWIHQWISKPELDPMSNPKAAHQDAQPKIFVIKSEKEELDSEMDTIPRKEPTQALAAEQVTANAFAKLMRHIMILQMMPRQSRHHYFLTELDGDWESDRAALMAALDIEEKRSA